MTMRLHVVDGTFELFRAHFAKRPGHTAPARPGHTASAGWDAKATVGVAASLLRLLQDPAERVTHIGVAFDNPIRSFRNRLYAGYKTEAGVPEELLRQFDPVEEAVRALGIRVWSMDEFEADDALATAAARWGERVEQVRIFTPDKDLGQCLRGDHVVQIDRIRQSETNEARLRERRGVGPQSIPDWLALVGDTADGYPGLQGFGEKTAAALLAEYRHLEHIPDDHRVWKGGVRGAERLAAVLRVQREQALLYRKLATLVSDVPLADTFEDLRWDGVPREAFTRWCEGMEAKALLGAVLRWR